MFEPPVAAAAAAPRDPAPMHGIRPPQSPQPPNLDGGHSAENWKIFKQKWTNYSIITNLDKQTRAYQVALLLHTLGDDGLRIYNGFQFETEEDERTVDEVLAKFDNFAFGEINETFERFVFNQRNQKTDKTFETFLAAIRLLVKTCNYHKETVNSILRDRIVLGISDRETQKRLLRERGLTLDGCIAICKTSENAEAHEKAMNADSSVNFVKRSSKNRTKSKMAPPTQKTGATPSQTARDCKFCGRTHIMRKSECPAWGKSCRSCQGLNHFAAKCTKQGKTKKVNQLLDEDSELGDDDCEWIDSIRPGNGHSPKDVRCRMMLTDSRQEVTFQVDTGASVNLIPLRLAVHTELSPTTKRLKMWNGSEIHPVGSCRLVVGNPKNRKRYSVEFVVVKENLMPLLGLKAAQGMKLVTVNDSIMERIAAVSVLDKFADVFDGKLGKLPGTVHLEVDGGVMPVVTPSRRIPVAPLAKLRPELERLSDIDVLARVEQPTPWVSQLVLAEKKSGELRICLDPRPLNRALKREHFQLPILEDKLHNLAESRVFSKLDLSSGYWHVELDEESSLLTTFQTLFGRYRWKRLPFGLIVASEIFQRKLLEAIDGLTGVECIADDVVIHGRNTEEHDRNLEAFLQRCREKGIKLNIAKLELRLSEITFMGHMVTERGLQADPEKVRAVESMSAPTNLEGLRRFLGVANYLAKFLPNLTEVTTPMRNLTKKDVPFVW
ncbi:uncharacterized protein K02A2.6-like [Lineus longissimus]|uniref:uncharacterized protein K02A2.6-like n=1 Tax=Lineus longissimus TaxID=88925 RepID=UPI00315D7AA3